MNKTYLMQRGEVFYFRRAIPADIRQHFFKQEIWKSTRCTRKREALALVRRWSSAFDDVATLIRSTVLTKEQIGVIVQDYMRTLLDGMEDLRDKGANLNDFYVAPPVYSSDFGPVIGRAFEGTFSRDGKLISADKRRELVRFYQAQINNLKEILTAGYVADRYEQDNCAFHVDLEIVVLSYQHGVTDENFRMFYRAYVKAKIAAYGVEMLRVKGDYGNSYDGANRGLLVKSEPVQQDEALPQGPLLSELVHQYFETQESQRQRKSKTVLEYRGMLDEFIEIIGDKRVDQLCRNDIHAYLKVAKGLPANRKKAKIYRDKSIDDILALPNVKPQAGQTIKNGLRQVKSFCAWLADEGYAERNVSTGINHVVLKRKRQNEERAAYSQQDVSNLVNGLRAERMQEHQRLGLRPNTTFLGRPERFWVPLLSLFCGFRLEEACQLLVTDIQQVEGNLCAVCDWFDEDGVEVKSLKNTASKRAMPIPQVLLDLGFMAFWAQTKAAGHTRLFHRLSKGRADGKYQANFRDWYNGQKGKGIGFENKYVDDCSSKSFHSLRHTYATALGHMDISDRLLSELMGHAKETLAANRYMKEYGLDKKLEVMNLIDYDVDFVGVLGHWDDWH